MDEIKFVIDELNKPPYNKNLNLVGYDNLRDEQRLDYLIQVLNVIDPKLMLPSIQIGSIEDIVTVVLDTLRIFKYTPPNSHSNPGTFRRDLILGEKHLLTHILHWLLSRMGALKKRAYLARFLVKIELSPNVEGDHDVVILYQQYLRMIEEFKKAHSNYETQKRSLDFLIELQKDIKTMEMEKDQIQAKLNIVKRRVNLSTTATADTRIVVASNSGSSLSATPTTTTTTTNTTASTITANDALFGVVKQFVTIRHENDKLQRQLNEQKERIMMTKANIEQQQSEINDYRAYDFITTGTNDNDGGGSLSLSSTTTTTPEMILNKLKEEISIKERLTKDVLPTELENIRNMVHDLESITNEQSENAIKEYLSKVNEQINTLNAEVAQLMERKIFAKDGEQDRLLHYRQNVTTVAKKKEETVEKFKEIENKIKQAEIELEQLRAKFTGDSGGGGGGGSDDDVSLRGDALRLYIDKINKREGEIKDKKQELIKLKEENQLLENKLSELKTQENKVMKEITNIEEMVGIEGYFQMKENTLSVVVDDNDDGIEDSGTEFTTNNTDVEPINAKIVKLEQQLSTVKQQLAPVLREVKQLKMVHHELENEYNMKKRMYDSAAAGLEADLSKAEAESERTRAEKVKKEQEQFKLRTQLTITRVERDWLLGSSSSSLSPGKIMNNDGDSGNGGNGSNGGIEWLIAQLKQEIKQENEREKELRERTQEMKQNEEYYRKQIVMWRNTKELLEMKAKLLAKKREEQAQQELMMNNNYNHLVL